MASTVKVSGLAETVRALNKVEPGLRKQFTRDAGKMARPAIEAAQSGYTEVPLSGMARNWSQKAANGRSRRIFPFSVAAARRGVKLKVDARRDAVAVMFVQQVNRGAAVFESAGRTTKNRLGDSLGPLPHGQTRIIGPRVYSKRDAVAREMVQVIRAYERRVNRELR